MKNKKLKLDALKVQSFVTAVNKKEKETVMGGMIPNGGYPVYSDIPQGICVCTDDGAGLCIYTDLLDCEPRIKMTC